MKRVISLVLVVVIIMTLITTVVADDTNKKWFADIPEGVGLWFRDNVYQLVDAGIIDGFPDGTFKPYSNLTIAQCLKLVITALGYSDATVNKSGYWADNYISKALDVGIILPGEYSKSGAINWFEAPASRAEVALFLSRAMWLYGTPWKENYWDYSKSIKDYDKIDDKYKEGVLRAYSVGIIAGYPDGTFGYNKDVTRAEISALILRLLHTDMRVAVKEPSKFSDPKRPYQYYDTDPVYLGIADLYPDNFERSDDGSNMFLSATVKQPHTNMKSSIVVEITDSMKYYLIGITDKNFTESDKPILKDLLKLMLPNTYETAYSKAMDFRFKDPNTPQYEGTLDNKKVIIANTTNGLFFMIDRTVK